MRNKPNFNPKDGKDVKDKTSSTKPDKGFRRDRKDKDGDKGHAPIRSNRQAFVNDPAYYLINPVLSQNAANISFGNPAGLAMRITNALKSDGSLLGGAYTVPGILVHFMMPTIGVSGAATDPINVSAKSMYSWVRHANSGHVNYDFPDLQLYLLAMREVYGFMGWITRLSALINLYNVENRYLPKSLFEANVVDGDDLLANQAAFRFYINTFAKKANALSVPSQLPMYRKAFNMYANVFREGKTVKDQLYLYSPSGFLIFNPTKYTTGGCLEYKSLFTIAGATTNLRFADIVTIGNALLAPLLGDEDIGIMSGDIRKAFGDDKLYLLGSIPTDLVLEPVVDAFELQIMHNVNYLAKSTRQTYGPKVLSVPTAQPLGDVVQDANGVIIQRIGYGKASDSNDVFFTDTNFIDVDSVKPTLEEIVETTLYKFTCIAKTDDSAISDYLTITGTTCDSTYLVAECGDYLCVSYDVLKTPSDTIPAAGSTGDRSVNVLNFEWSPIHYEPQYNGSGYDIGLGPTQWHNFSVISGETLRNIHMADMLSLFAIPAVEHIK